MGVAKSAFSRMRCRSRLDLIKNAERFARIDLDRSRLEKERNHYRRNARLTCSFVGFVYMSYSFRSESVNKRLLQIGNVNIYVI